MTSITGTFSGAAKSAVLSVGDVPQTLDYALTGGTWTTPGAGISLQKEASPGSSAWLTVAGPFTADASGSYQTGANERYRWLSALTTGSVPYTLSDRVEVLQEIRDASGNLMMRFTESGVEFPGDLTVTGDILAPSASAGTAATGATAVEWGVQNQHTTVLTMADLALGTSGDNAAKAIGGLLYTFPAGIIQVDSVSLINVGITADISVTTDTPEVGLGTTVGSGANATLGAVGAGAENLSEGGDTTNIAPDVAGTATINSTKKPTVASGDDGPLIIAAGSAHTVYFNAAVTWANVTAAGAVTADGIVVINWKKLS
jgi:hypothetical protein